MLSLAMNARAGIIFSNPIDDNNASDFNPYTTGQTVDSNITVSGIGRGTGISSSSGANKYNAENWTLVPIIDASTTAYFTFTLDANPGFETDFTSLAFTAQMSGSGPNKLALRSSADGFASNLFLADVFDKEAPTPYLIGLGTVQNVSGPIEFRLYGFFSNNLSGTFSVNDFAFSGNVVPQSVPEPTTMGALGVFGVIGGIASYLRRRKHKKAFAA